MRLTNPTSWVGRRIVSDAVASAARVGMYGSRRPLVVAAAADGETGIRVMVPTADPDAAERHDNRASMMHTFYLLLELAH